VSVPGLTIDDSARFLGHVSWVERRLFEVLGGWVLETPEPAVKLAFARHSRHHAWYAELIEPLRPDTRDHDLEARAPLDVGWRSRVNKMLAATTTPQRLVRLLDTLVGTIALYEQYLGATRAVRDAPTRRVLGLVVEAERAELGEFEVLQRIDAGIAANGR
jgi:hypothetical protein